MNVREQYIVDKILSYDEYIKKDGISASQLGRPPLQLKLAKENPNHQEESDLSLRLASKIGTAFHSFAEKALSDDESLMLEKTLFGKIGEQEISGTYDIYDTETKIIYDIKTMQSWKANALFFPDHKNHKTYLEEFIPQMSQLKYLMNQTCECNKVKIIVWVVDWKKPYLRKDGTHTPTAPRYFTLEVPTMDDKQFEEFVNKKVQDMKLPYSVLPKCEDCSNEGWRYQYCDFKTICPKVQGGF